MARKSLEEVREALEKKGTNDHGIVHLIRYTVSRFAAGFVSASVVAVLVGAVIGLSPVLYRALNPFIQILKPISPLAWMPLLLYSVQDPTWTAILVVFMASLWPTIANTAFGVSTIRRDYLQVASLLQLSWLRRLVTVILPAAAPAIVAGLRFAVAPKVLLLDEPFAQIDALTRGVIQEELIRMWSATQNTVFMVTHDVDEAILLSDRIALMTNGPEARLAECIEVNLPRPRHRETMIDSSEYTRLRNHILHFLLRGSQHVSASARTGVTPNGAGSLPEAAFQSVTAGVDLKAENV